MFISELARGQAFGQQDEICRKVCQEWEGDRFAINTICYKRYRICRQNFYEDYFEDKGRILYRSLKNLFTTIGEN